MSNSNQKKWVIHYRKNCIGCGNCSFVCPKYWQMNQKDGKADLLDSENIKDDIHKRKLDIEDTEKNEMAAQLCPVGIIKVS
jgi:ferredoxin